jgi:triacylglycerol lipase
LIDDPQAAADGLLVLGAQDVFSRAPTDLSPELDPRATAAGWEILGHLTACDAVFRRGPMGLGFTVCYGYLARSVTDPSSHVAVIRGTGSIIEWIEDAEFRPRSQPGGFGQVEAGFDDLYQSLGYTPLGGTLGPSPATIASTVGAGTIRVIGHSLGAALATYLAFDIAADLGDRLSACFLASPQPGDAAFAAAVNGRIKNYKLIDYQLDAVPHLPFGPDYAHLPRALWLSPKDIQARIAFGLANNHHVTSYAAMLSYQTTMADLQLFPPVDLSMLACIKGAIEASKVAPPNPSGN